MQRYIHKNFSTSLIYKSLPEKVQFLLQQACADLLPKALVLLELKQESSQLLGVDEKLSAIQVLFHEYLDDHSDINLDQLAKLQILFGRSTNFYLNVSFLTSLDKAFCSVQFYRPLQIPTRQPSGEMKKEFQMRPQKTQLHRFDDFCVQLKAQQSYEAFGSFRTLNLREQQPRFKNLLYLLLNLNPNPQLSQFVKILQLQPADIQKFVMGDAFIQMKLILDQLFQIFSNLELYNHFLRIIEKVGEVDRTFSSLLVKRQFDDFQQESFLQLQFLIQLVNLQPWGVLELETNTVSPFFNQLYLLSQLGLASFHVQQTQAFVAVSDVLSLQQFSPDQQIQFLQIYNLKMETEKKPLFVESTGRITYYRAGTKQDQINEEILGHFCSRQHSLEHCAIFQLSQQAFVEYQLQAALVCRFLKNNSEKPIPADLINLIDSWESKTMFVEKKKIVVFRVGECKECELVHMLLYYKVLTKCLADMDSQIVWYDAEHFREIQEHAALYEEFIQKRLQGSQKYKVQKAKQKLMEGGAKTRLLIVKEDAADEVQARFKKYTEYLKGRHNE